MNKQHISIESYQNKLLENSVEIIKNLIEDINQYLSNFDRATSFSFSKIDTEKYENSYMNFLLKISPKISELTAINAETASLIITSDRAQKIEIKLILEKRFDAFCLFEKALYEYTSNIDNAFLNDKITASFIVSNTQKFKMASQFLLNEIL